MAKKHTLAVWYHPGESLKERLEEMGLSEAEFAKKCGLSEETISAFISGQIPVTDEFASVLETASNVPAKLWIGLQKGYDDYLTKKDRKPSWTAAAL